MQFARSNIRPWELDLLTYDEYLTFKIQFRSEPLLGGV